MFTVSLAHVLKILLHAGAPVPLPFHTAAVQVQIQRLISSRDLPPSMTEVALGIWYALSEKQLAVWVEKPKDTVHEHLRRLYRDQRWPDMKCRVTVALAVERTMVSSIARSKEQTEEEAEGEFKNRNGA